MKKMVFPILMLLASCAMSPPAKREVASVQERAIQSLPEQSVNSDEVKLFEELEIVAGDAKRAGPDVVRWLSTDLFLKANDAASRGDIETSVVILNTLVDLNPTDHFLKQKLAIETLRSGELEKAEQLLADLYHQSKVTDEVVALIYAGVLTAREKPEQARTLYQEILAHHPKSEEACIFLSKTYVESEEQAKAIKLLRQCEKDQKSPIFPYYLGKMSVEQQDLKAGKEHFHRALALDENYHSAMVALALIEESEENYDVALEYYLKILEQRPDSFGVLSRVVQLLFAQERYEELIPMAESLLTLDPTDISLRVRLGVLYTDSKNYDLAIGHFKSVLTVVPDSDKVLYYLGALYQEIQQFDQAISYFGKIPSESPLFHDSHLQIANILHAQAIENTEEEKLFYRYVLEVKNEHPSLAFDLTVLEATLHESYKRYEQASVALETLRTHERFGEAHYYYLAVLFEKQGKIKESLAELHKILEINPDHAHALNFLGYTMIESGENLDQAYQFIQRAVSLKPDDGYIRDSLGWYYYKTGNYQKALKEISTAQTLVQDDHVISKHLAIVYQALENYDMARKFYMEAITHCRHEYERQPIQEALEQLENKRSIASESSPSSD
jgi:tetratricopeptide (TPR) repeat protein